MIKITPDLEQNFITFSGGEEHVQINPEKLSSNISITAQIDSSQELIRLFLIMNAINEASFTEPSHMVNLTIDMYYLPYARQDRVCSPGQAFSLEVFFKLFNSIAESCYNLNTVVNILDPHSDEVISLAESLVDSFRANFNFHSQLSLFKNNKGLSGLIKSVDLLIAPDKGAINKTKALGNHFDIPIISFDKTRNSDTGFIENMFIDGYDFQSPTFKSFPSDVAESIKGRLLEKIQGKVILIPDDICDGGMTFKMAADVLEEFEPKAIYLYVTHGIFSKGLDELSKKFDKIFTYNNINNHLHPSLTQV